MASLRQEQKIRLKSWDRRPDSPEINQALTDLRQAFEMLFFADADHCGLEKFIERMLTEMRTEEARRLSRAVRDAEPEAKVRQLNRYDDTKKRATG